MKTAPDYVFDGSESAEWHSLHRCSESVSGGQAQKGSPVVPDPFHPILPYSQRLYFPNGATEHTIAYGLRRPYQTSFTG